MEQTLWFDQFHGVHLRNGSYNLAKYRVGSMGVFRRTDAQARRYLFGDIRVKEGLDFEEISFLVALGKYAHPNGQAASVRGGRRSFRARRYP